MNAPRLDQDEEMPDAEDEDVVEDEVDEEDDMDDEAEGQEIVDQMALEEAELRRDARGVEERDGAHNMDED